MAEHELNKIVDDDGEVFNLRDSTKQPVADRVTAWGSTPSDTKYPSEKLVKDGLDAKANASDAVGLADSVYRRVNEAGDGWNKLAETTFTRANTNVIGFFDVYYGQLGTAVGYMSAKFNVRVDGSGSTPMIKNVNYIKVSGLNTYSLCVVVRGLTGNVTVELWGYLPKDNISMSIVFRACTVAQSDWKFAISKSSWTFYNYSGTSTSKPVADAGNNVQVTDASEIVIQKNIASPTNNNLVAMDANGLVKDSGLTKSSVESAISSAGSAIQGVKVNNTTLTPDANKVVTVPLATTSADGAMSAADKTKLNNAVTKKTGIAYKGTAGGDVFKIAEKAYSITTSHSEQFVFHVAYSKHATNAATSELNVLLKVVKDGNSEVTVFRNTVTSKQGFGALDWTFKASADDTNGLFTLYAVRTAGQYTTVEATCIAVNSERNNLIDNVVVFENTAAELPETVFTETTVYAATSNASSGTAPVKVDEYGALTPVPRDSTPTASSTNLMTSGDIKKALDKKANLNNFRMAVGTKGLKLRFSANANLYDGVFATILNGYGGIAYRSITFGIRRQSNALPSVHRYNTEISSEDYSTGKNFSLYYGTDPSDENYKILLIVPAGSIQGLLNLSTSGTASEWSLLSETPSTDGLTQITPTEHTNVFGANKGSESVPVYVDASGAATPCTDDFVHDGDVASTYSATGTDPVNGTAVAAAISGKADKVSITGATKCKITYNSQGIVTAGADLANTDLPKFIYNCGYASTRMNGAPAYDSSTPYKLIGKCTYTTAGNRTAWERFLLMYADTLFEFKLKGIWWKDATGPSLSIHPIAVYGTSLDNTKTRFYPRYSFTQNSATGLVIEFYVKFTGDWQNFRLYQLPAQSGDNGATEFNAFTMSTNATAIATLPNTAIDFYDGDDKVTVFGHISTADKATSDSDGNAINSTYLKLSGGTMTGKITALGSQYTDSYTSGAIDMQNSNIVGLNAIYTKDASENASEGIHFYRDATHTDTLWMAGGHMYFVPNRTLAGSSASTSAADSKKVAILPASITTNQMVVTDGTSGDVKGVVAYTGRGVIAAVGLADGRRNRGNATGDGWGKIASITKSSGIASTNISSVWSIVCNTSSTNSVYILRINIRGTSGSLPSTQLCKLYGNDDFDSTRFGIKLVIRGTSASSVTAEIWACTSKNYTGIAISELADGNMEMLSARQWTYYTVSGGGEAAPVADATNNVQVVDPVIDTYSWNHFYNGYKEVTFDSSVTVATFLSNAQTANSFANKVFGAGLTDTALLTINAIGRLNISNNTNIQTELENLGSYPMFHVVVTRQAGYVEFEGSGKKVRYHFGTSGALTNKYYEFVKLNNSVSATPSFYAPTAGGTANYVLIGNGTTSAPTWAEKAPKAVVADYPAGFTGYSTAAVNWGTLKDTTKYDAITKWSNDNCEIAFAKDKTTPSGHPNKTLSVQVDGYFYQNEGQYRVLDTSNVSVPTTVPTLAWNTESTLATIDGKNIKVKLPASPDTDVKVTQTVDSATTGNLPLLAKNTTATATITDTSRFAAAVSMTPSTGTVNATQYKVNEHCTMKYNSTKSSLDFTFS